ncbi:MAG TPA: hypothetical protein VNS58_23870 [Puia sp.]|nr:hypothetical protein [Puia sp.]
MHLERYEFKVKDNRYTFFSQGPKGEIEKAVLYNKLSEYQPLYGLSFGDWKEKVNRIDDRVVTNNGDRQKILATVAATVVNFSMQNPDAFIFAVGSTSARTRLYQMNIASNLTFIHPLFEIEGFIRNNWQSFQTGCNYSAFLLKPRNFLSS